MERCYFPNWESGRGRGNQCFEDTEPPGVDVLRGQESRHHVKSQVLPCEQNHRAPQRQSTLSVNFKQSAASAGWSSPSHQGSAGSQPQERQVLNRTAPAALLLRFPLRTPPAHCLYKRPLLFSTGAFQHWEHTWPVSPVPIRSDKGSSASSTPKTSRTKPSKLHCANSRHTGRMTKCYHICVRVKQEE